jgi:hypothetical protein
MNPSRSKLSLPAPALMKKTDFSAARNENILNRRFISEIGFTREVLWLECC